MVLYAPAQHRPTCEVRVGRRQGVGEPFPGAYACPGWPRIDWSQLFAQQEWSQNYALMESVTCSSAEMTNGDLKTVGSSGHQILIELPERKAIPRIVIRQTNIEDLILYAGASKSQGDWRKVATIKDNRQTTFKI